MSLHVANGNTDGYKVRTFAACSAARWAARSCFRASSHLRRELRGAWLRIGRRRNDRFNEIIDLDVGRIFSSFSFRPNFGIFIEKMIINQGQHSADILTRKLLHLHLLCSQEKRTEASVSRRKAPRCPGGHARRRLGGLGENLGLEGRGGGG